MLEFVARLRKEMDDAIQIIETSDSSILRKSLDALHVLTNAFDQLFFRNYFYRTCFCDPYLKSRAFHCGRSGFTLNNERLAGRFYGFKKKLPPALTQLAVQLY